MRILVSACLTGTNCKYNGGNNLNQKVVDFVRGHEVLEICPEMLVGMEVPRACAEIVNGRVVDCNGQDVHQDYLRGVELALEVVAVANQEAEIELAILQSRSPTCGVNQVYDGNFRGQLIQGRGLFTAALLERGYRVVDAEDI
jgi:uncharacterized protein YbbK (DUF523 family)